MRGYLDAVDPAQFIDVELSGISYRVSRARLGLHLRLARIAERFDEEPGPEAVREYLDACGLPVGHGVETLAVFVALRFLNDWQWVLPFMSQRANPDRKAAPYDYDDRTWAWNVHKLASRYGWTREEIFDLWPEEGACYLQEIFVAEYDEMEAERGLSELSYRYDKGSKFSRFIPTPRPGWMGGNEAPKVRRVLKSALPVGNVIKLDDLAKTIH